MDGLPAEIDYENWMGNLPAVLAKMPIHAIALPGSHDSFSYSISRSSPVAPDDDNLSFINTLPSVFERFAKWIVYRWSLTQRINCTEQLKVGIRYFDLRLAPMLDSGEVCLVHGLYGLPVLQALNEINAFLILHPKEIVLLDFQHFYQFTNDTHTTVIANLIDTFGSKLCPFTENVSLLTLSSLWTSGHQVFVFYRYGAVHWDHNLWPSSKIPNPWPETTSPQEMVEFLETRYKAGRKPNTFYVTQGILTPDKSYVSCRWFMTLERTLVPVANSTLLSWLKGKSPGEQGINVVISDFVGSSSSEVVKSVIALNYSK